MSDSRDTVKIAPGPLYGERVVVRPYTDEDARSMFEAIRESEEHLRPWMPWVEQHHTVDDTLDYVRQCQVGFLLRTGFSMGFFSRAEGRYLGGSGLHIRNATVPFFEIGYWVRAREEGRGYVTEAVRLLTVCAFETLAAERVVIRCDARNERSKRVAERLDYVFEGTMRHEVRDTSGNLADILVYSMIRPDFERSNGPQHA